MVLQDERVAVSYMSKWFKYLQCPSVGTLERIKVCIYHSQINPVQESLNVREILRLGLILFPVDKYSYVYTLLKHLT